MKNIKVNEISREIVINYLADSKKESMILFGPPGIGKTQCIREGALACASSLNKVFIDYSKFCLLSEEEQYKVIKDAGKEVFFFVDMNLQTRDPVDFYGRPVNGVIKGNGSGDTLVTDFIPPRAVAYLCQFPGIIFMDEITNVHRPDLISIAMRLSQERKVSDYAISDDVMIIMAGNRPEHSALARALPAPMINRCILYDVVATSAEEWIDYITGRYNVEEFIEIVGYLASLAGNFQKIENGREMRAFATPRSCEKLLNKIIGFRGLVEKGFISANEAENRIDRISIGLIGDKEGSLFNTWRKNFAYISYDKLVQEIKGGIPSVVCGISAFIGKELAKVIEGKRSRFTKDELVELIKLIDRSGPEYISVMLTTSSIMKFDKYDNIVSSLKNFYKIKNFINGEAQDIPDFDHKEIYTLLKGGRDNFIKHLNIGVDKFIRDMAEIYYNRCVNTSLDVIVRELSKGLSLDDVIER